MIKSHIFSTWPSICQRKSVKTSTKPQNTVPYRVNKLRRSASKLHLDYSKKDALWL